MTHSLRIARIGGNQYRCARLLPAAADLGGLPGRPDRPGQQRAVGSGGPARCDHQSGRHRPGDAPGQQRRRGTHDRPFLDLSCQMWQGVSKG